MANRPAANVASPVAADPAVHESNSRLRPEPAPPRRRPSTFAASARALLRPRRRSGESASSAKSAVPRVSPRIERKRSSRFVPPDLGRHARKCTVCRHPRRKSIEADYLDWCKADWIRTNYGLATDKAIYGHARATGLDVRRRENIRLAAEKILERVDQIGTPSAMDIIRAVRTLACINERGQWVEPPKPRIVVVHTEPANSLPSQSPAPSSEPGRLSRQSSSFSPASASESTSSGLVTNHSSLATAISDRQTPLQLETDLTRRKQTSPAISNRPKYSSFSAEPSPQ